MSNGFLNLVNRDGINYWVTDSVSLIVPGAEGDFLRTVNGVAAWASDSILDTYVTAVTASAPLASSGGTTPNITISSSTGTGSVVLSTSPTITTPSIATINTVPGDDFKIQNAVGLGNSHIIILDNGSIDIQGEGGAYLSMDNTLGNFGLLAQSPTVASIIQGVVTLYGSLATSTVAGGTGNLSVAGTTTLSALTTSTALALDASKNIVSVTNTGTGSNVLGTSPTISSINTVAATTFTIQGAGLSRFRIAAAGAIDVQGAGGANLSMDDTLGNFQLNAQSATTASSIQAALTVFGTLATSTANGGTGNFSAAGTLSVTGAATLSSTLAITGAATLSSTLDVVGVTSIYPSGTASGVILNVFKPSLASGGEAYILIGRGGTVDESIALAYRHNTTVNSRELAFGFTGQSDILTLKRNGNSVAVANALTVGGAATLSSTLYVTGNFRSQVNYGRYSMSGDFGWPNATSTVCGNWTAAATAGETLTLTTGDSWVNNLGRTVYVTFTWTGRRASNGLGASEYWLECGGIKYSSSQVGALDRTNLVANISMNASEAIQVLGFQDSGSGNNFLATDSWVTIIVQH